MRRKKNKSGLISVQVIDKSTGRYKVVKTIGSSRDREEVNNLALEGRRWIDLQSGQVELDFGREQELARELLDHVTHINVAGIELLLGGLFDSIGFDKIAEPLFKKLVLARLSYPASKLKTTDYLYKYHSVKLDLQSFYPYLKKLHDTQKEEVQRISYEHTLKVLGGTISLVFYDVTTLYFEIEREDGLRKTGFSKDGKHQNPQIVLGLLVSTGGYPLAYEIFEGNKMETHTLVPVIDTFKEKYRLAQLVVVADSGLLSKENIAALENNGYDYILGARIKNENKQVTERILSLGLKDGQSKTIRKNGNIRLIVHYSGNRAKKDRANREKGLGRLKKKIRSGKLTKANINNRGYNKYLKLEGEINITIDVAKFEEDAKWDGLKGYQTNTALSEKQIISNYRQLWKIEKVFRVSKSDLKIRPIYHRLQRRIEAHICITFTAYKIYKELERQLKEKRSGLSPEQAIEIAKTIYNIEILTPRSKKKISKTVMTNDEQKILADLFQF